MEQYIPTKKGAFAFEYNTKFAIDDAGWFSRFEIFVPGSILPEDIIQQYKKNGTRLLFYEWAVAFYEIEAKKDRWYKNVLNHHPEWLLNKGKPVLIGKNKIPAWYYNMGNKELQASRAQHLLQKLQSSEYDGIFMDCLGTFDYKEIPEHLVKIDQEFKSRHGNLVYAKALGEFLNLLKNLMGSKILFTNQGYRNAGYYLKNTDVDLTESYITTHAGSKAIDHKGTKVPLTNFHPWYDETQLWSSSKFIIDHFTVKNLKDLQNKPEIFHLNYCYPVFNKETNSFITDREAIYYSYCTAKLFGHAAYVQHQQIPGEPNSKLNHDDLYFIDLGKIVSVNLEIEGGLVGFAEYENAYILLNGTGYPYWFSINHEKLVFDIYNKVRIAAKNIYVPANQQSDGTRTSTGRVYLKI